MISIIVPVYNSEKYLHECLDSIANQTYQDIEVIMVNDGSSDSSREICREYEQKYNRFKLINKENGGQMSAWILGVKHAQGDYLGFVDSDDYIAPTMYEEMMNYQKRTGADLIMCNFFDLTTNGAKPRPSILEAYYGEDNISEIYTRVFPSMRTYISTSRWDKLFKRDLYIENMEKYCDYISRTFEDRFIVSPYYFSCKSVVYIEKPLYYWRKCKVSSSRKPRLELCEIMEELYLRQKKMLVDKGFYNEYKDCLEIGKIDLMRMIIERNLESNISYREKIKIAKLLLTKENRNIVLSHKSDCIGKFGKYIYTVCKFNSSILMILGALLMQILHKDNNEDAFE